MTLLNTIKKAGGRLLDTVTVFDVYMGDNVDKIQWDKLNGTIIG